MDQNYVLERNRRQEELFEKIEQALAENAAAVKKITGSANSGDE